MFQVYLFFLVLCGGLALLSVLGDFLDTDVGELDVDVDADFDADFDADLDAEVDADADLEADTAAEKIFSIRGLLYSLFGFGLTGTLLTMAGAGAAAPATIGVSAGSGLAAGWIVTKLLSWIRGSEAGVRAGDSSFVGRAGRMTLPMESEGKSGRVRVRRGERTYDLRALPHPGASAADDPGEWEEVMVIEVREGVALVTPVDDEGYPLEP
ncbi:MAG: hypothetical protein ACOC83_10375 [Gemmatimonadota bacterium]